MEQWEINQSTPLLLIRHLARVNRSVWPRLRQGLTLPPKFHCLPPLRLASIHTAYSGHSLEPGVGGENATYFFQT